MDALAVLHGLYLFGRQVTGRVVVKTPCPVVLIVDRHPEVAVGRVVAAWRHHREAGHDPWRDAPVVLTLFGIAARADEQAAIGRHHLEHRLQVFLVVLVSLGTLEQRVGIQVATVQERDVARIDAAFQRLQPVAFLAALGGEALAGRHGGKLPFRQRRLQFGRAHVDPDHTAALDQRVGLELDFVAIAALTRLRRDIDALAVNVVFPAVVRAADAVFFIAAKPQRHAAVGTKLVDHAQPALRVAEREQALRQQLQPDRRTVGLGQLLGQQRGQPVAAKQLTHRRVGTGLG